MTQITSLRNHDTGVSGSSGHAKVQRDIPMPSTEDAETLSETSASSRTTEGHYRLRTPSLSVSPPPLAGDEELRIGANTHSLTQVLHDPMLGVQASSPAGEGRDKAGNAQSLEQRPLASLADLATAIDDVRTNLRYPEAGPSRLNPAHTYGAPGRPTSPRPTPTRSRRSSSRSPRHDVTSEEPPQDMFYDEDFQQAYMSTKRLVRDLSSALGSTTLHQEVDSAMGKLYDTSVRLADFQHPTNSMVGFVGDSGVGKSSLINSLLDKAGLVRASNSGGACTCVATEFHYREQNTFSIEVDLFNEDELLEQLSQMAESYHRFYLSENEIDDTDRNELEERANLASDTLHSMFRSRLGDIDSLLEGPTEEIISTFRSWISELKPSMAGDTHAGLSQDDCSAVLRQLSSEPASASQRAAWPYIRKIRVFLNAHILSNGLVLVDLPGLRDMNTARRNITERFIRECDEIFVVCQIGRAATDEGVDSVFKMAEKAELCNVGIICTKSDDIIPEEAVIDLAGYNADRITELLDVIGTKKEELLELTADVESYAEEDDLDAEEREYRYQMSVHKDNADRDLKGLELELKTLLVQTRNESVTRRLRSEYNGRHLGDGDVNVFCVSNTLYIDNREGTSNITHRYLALSGIIEVRRYCISIVSARQHRAATRYMIDSVPSLLANVELWVQSGINSLDAERRATVRRAISKIEKRFLGDLLGSSALVQNICPLMTRSFNNHIYDSSAEYIHAWSEAAREAGFEWSTWHHSTYSAFCRKSGCHCTPAVGQRDWNEEIIARMVEDLRGPWTNLEGDIRLQKNEAFTSVSALTDWAIRTVEDELNDNLSTFIPLRRALMTHQHLLVHDIEKAFEQADTDLRKLRVDTFTGLQTSFIGVAMEPSYRACRHEGGTGSHARRNRIIENTLSKEQLFLDIMKKLQNRHQVVANSVQSRVRGSVDANLSHIRSTLNLVRDDNVALESQRDLEFNKKVHEAVQAANRCIHEIHEKLSI